MRGQICFLLARLRIHSPDCEHCTARQACGSDLLKRLEELNWRTRKTEDVVKVADSRGTSDEGDGEAKLSA